MDETLVSGVSSRGLSTTVCLLCRQRKVKCDRRRPSCGHCSKNGFSCRWVDAQQKPGLRAGYVSGLEKRLRARTVLDVHVFPSIPYLCESLLYPCRESILEREVRELKNQRPVQADILSDTSSRSCTESLEHGSLQSISPTDHTPTLPTFDPLAPPVLNELCGLWFQDYHSWFPVLHQPSILDALHSPSLASSPLFIIFRAIAATTVMDFSGCSSPPLEDRQQCSRTLRGEAVMQAMQHLSLPSLQAILILTILDYGAGKLSECWNLVGLCKRMSTQLGLHDLVVNQCANFNQLSSIPPRMLPLPSTLVSQEENIRAYWMTEVLDASTTMGVAWNLSLSLPKESALLPCNNAVWSYPESAIGMWSFDDLEFSSSFSLYVSLATNELWHVHNFLQQAYDMRSATDRNRAQMDCQEVDARLVDWHAGPGAIAFTFPERDLSSESAPAFDPNILMARCTFDAAVIAMYQRLTLPPPGLEQLHEPWYHAIQRCLNSCNDITTAVRSLADPDLGTTNPQLSFCMFIAARFLLLHARSFNLDVPPDLDLLVYALKICGRRWKMARRLEKVIRTAIAEYKFPLSMTSLPAQFHDLQYSALDIDEALRVWAEKLQPWVHLLQNAAPAIDAANAGQPSRDGQLGPRLTAVEAAGG